MNTIENRRHSRSLYYTSFFLLMILLSIMSSGCSSLPGWAGKQPPPAGSSNSPAPTPTDSAGQPIVKFSDHPNTMVPSNRVYRRMTRSRLEEESEVQAQAGSMWIMEGQGAYLFTQNKTRKEGDVLTLKLEGAGQKQVETKVNVIKKLLKQLDEQNAPAVLPEQLAPGKLAVGTTAPAADNQARTPAAAPAEKEADEPVDIGEVPMRITERTGDGNYRVKGQQPFMIGKREYKVIVTGLIRSEDFNDEGVNSSKLIESQYDVVSLRRREVQ